jgi:hypothetical protein
MKIHRIVLIAAFCLSCSLAHLSQTAPEPPRPMSVLSWAKIEDGLFKSERLGLTLKFPKEFTVLSTVEAEVISKAGADLVKKGATSEKRFVEAVENSKKLLILAEKPYGTPGNSALEIVAAKQPSGATANMSLAANLSVLKGTAFELKNTKSPLKVGKNSYATADLEGTFSGILLKQRMFVLIHKGYAIVTVITYSVDEQLTKMQEVLSTLSLTK